MTIKLNSNSHEIEAGTTVSMLLKQLNMPETSVAVAVNGKIILAAKRSVTTLNPDDDVIIIGAAYGG